MKKYYTALSNGRNEFLFSVFAGIGFVVFFFCHARTATWYQILGIATYDFTLVDALFSSVLWFSIIFLTLWLVIVFCSAFNVHGVTGPAISVTLLFTLGIISLFTISKGINAYNLSYLFALIGILGISLFIYFNKRTSIEFNHGDVSIALEVLRMEHRELLQHINQTIWAIVAIFTGAVVAGLIPIATSPQSTPSSIEGVGITLLNHAILIIYFMVGAWFGIVYQLNIRLANLRKNVLELKDKTNS